MSQFNAQTQGLLYWQRSDQFEIKVEQDGRLRSLSINGQRQSQLDLLAPCRPVYPYVQQILLYLRQFNCQRILQIGLGAGEINRAVLDQLPSALLTTVEKDPLVISLYQQFFQMPAFKTREIILPLTDLPSAHTLAPLDALIVDIYPWPPAFASFVEPWLKLLAPSGILLMNVSDPTQQQAVKEWCQQHFNKFAITTDTGYLNHLFCCSQAMPCRD